MSGGFQIKGRIVEKYLILFSVAVFLISLFILGCDIGVPDAATTTLGSTTTTTAAGTTTTTSTSPTTTFVYVMGTASYDVPSLSLPTKGASFADPNFHTTITRISDKTTDGYSGAGIENEYARSNPENNDGTRVVLRGNDGEWYLYNAAAPYNLVKNLNILSGSQEPEPRWDAANSKIFYYLFGTELRSYNIDTDNSTTVHDFKNDFPSADHITTKTEGDASVDRRYWCFMVGDAATPNPNVLAVIVYDKTSDGIIGQKTTFPDVINWVSMDMSGSRCIIGYDSLDTQVFPKNLNNSTSPINLPLGARGHMDLAQTIDGKDVMVYQKVTGGDVIAMADLDTATETQLVDIPFNVNTDIGLHFAGNCAQTPGWVLVSTYGALNPVSGESHSWMDNQLFMVELKSNPRIWRIADTHSYTSSEAPASNYIAEAFATINTKGTKIHFGSNWGDYTTDYTEAYQIALPTNWQNNIP